LEKNLKMKKVVDRHSRSLNCSKNVLNLFNINDDIITTVFRKRMLNSFYLKGVYLISKFNLLIKHDLNCYYREERISTVKGRLAS
jgi:hypothetical protein